MKLRLQGGSLRLRLSQSEIARLRSSSKVEEAIVFAPGSRFLYTLETADVPQVTAQFQAGNISVILPAADARQWIDSDQTGIEGVTGDLKLIIEKDFQCIHREPEAGEDPFPNPHMTI